MTCGARRVQWHPCIFGGVCDYRPLIICVSVASSTAVLCVASWLPAEGLALRETLVTQLIMSHEPMGLHAAARRIYMYLIHYHNPKVQDQTAPRRRRVFDIRGSLGRRSLQAGDATPCKPTPANRSHALTSEFRSDGCLRHKALSRV